MIKSRIQNYFYTCTQDVIVYSKAQLVRNTGTDLTFPRHAGFYDGTTLITASSFDTNRLFKSRCCQQSDAIVLYSIVW